ncbi:MAG TPA: hypothetical protein PKH02_08325 [Bacteroidales bacterium]|nr:hypothetical protein [Bacteroidales bacterium]HPT12383.1 hypothetical protein [Bacteroidales bacterium]
MSNYSEFSSRRAVAKCSNEALYKLITDFRNISKFATLDEFEAEATRCSFSVNPVGRVDVNIVSSTPSSEVIVKGNTSLTGEVDLKVNIEPIDQSSCAVLINFGLELSPFLRIAFGGQIENMLETLASAIEEHKFNEQ